MFDITIDCNSSLAGRSNNPLLQKVEDRELLDRLLSASQLVRSDNRITSFLWAGGWTNQSDDL